MQLERTHVRTEQREGRVKKPSARRRDAGIVMPRAQGRVTKLTNKRGNQI